MIRIRCEIINLSTEHSIEFDVCTWTGYRSLKNEILELINCNNIEEDRFKRPIIYNGSTIILEEILCIVSNYTNIQYCATNNDCYYIPAIQVYTNRMNLAKLELLMSYLKNELTTEEILIIAQDLNNSWNFLPIKDFKDCATKTYVYLSTDELGDSYDNKTNQAAN